MKFSNRKHSPASLPVALGLAVSAVAPALASPLYYDAASAFVSQIQAAAAAAATPTGSSSLSGGQTTGGAYSAAVSPAQIQNGNTSNYLYYNCVNKGQFALTFDDGPQANHAKIRALLDKYNAKGTFFVNGFNWDCIYNQDISESLQQSYSEGHQVASHTWGHDDITKLTTAQLNNQMQLIEDALMKILGMKPAMFRPPYGNFNNQALATIAQRNYSAVIIWDGISGASTGTSVQQSLSWYQGNAASYPNPHIILNHEQDNDALAQIYEPVLQMLTKAGYKLVTVAQCLNMAPYQSTSKLGTRDSSWTCDGKPAPGAPQ